MDIITSHILIKGRVQGVWYRKWVMDTANEKGLSGWVRNTGSNGVEALIKGPKDQVEEIIEACYEGPSLARVDSVDVLRDSIEDLSPVIDGEFRFEETV